ncbi:DUF2938 domain-containing protein [Povalibacter sp.]|uniref:DUF2938 domain-containing protein n=1 Tax=Povalibacter sp. TaxID=1962978 RepID=UPI002F40AD07
MDDALEYLLPALIIGAGATTFTDLVAVARTRLFGVPSPDYGLVGRWLANVARGQVRQDPIATTPRIRGELLIGWSAHYLIGVAFAGLLLAIFGLRWSCHPTIGAALLVGIGSVVAPFMLMQPGMGGGIAASRTPRPTQARLRSLVTHAIFGVGLYVAALLARSLEAFQCAASH